MRRFSDFILMFPIRIPAVRLARDYYRGLVAFY